MQLLVGTLIDGMVPSYTLIVWFIVTHAVACGDKQGGLLLAQGGKAVY